MSEHCAPEHQKAQKRKLEHVTENCTIVLLDIEGTTTSISFVKHDLFPYILRKVKTYVEEHYDDEVTQNDIEALRKLAEEDSERAIEGVISIPSSKSPKEEVIEKVVKNVEWQMSLDRKTTALKQLQGHMWQNAYKEGHVKGHLYPEVYKCIQKWQENGKKICIYSSGSVEAQKLLFTYSVNGDVTPLLTDYFDTKVGGKREASSYTKIAEILKVRPEDVLFLTDIYEEAKAAKEAGMSSVISVRPGNTPLTDEQRAEFKTITGFDQISFTDEAKKIAN